MFSFPSFLSKNFTKLSREYATARYKYNETAVESSSIRIYRKPDKQTNKQAKKLLHSIYNKTISQSMNAYLARRAPRETDIQNQPIAGMRQSHWPRSLSTAHPARMTSLPLLESKHKKSVAANTKKSKKKNKKKKRKTKNEKRKAKTQKSILPHSLPRQIPLPGQSGLPSIARFRRWRGDGECDSTQKESDS
jgi:hypothetical protein